MTCILTVPDATQVVMMADSGSGQAGEIFVSPVPKIFRCDEYLMGFSGSWRVGQVVRGLDFGEPSGDVLAYMSGPFVDVLAAGLDETEERWGKGYSTTPGAEAYKLPPRSTASTRFASLLFPITSAW